MIFIVNTALQSSDLLLVFVIAQTNETLDVVLLSLLFLEEVLVYLPHRQGFNLALTRSIREIQALLSLPIHYINAQQAMQRLDLLDVISVELAALNLNQLAPPGVRRSQRGIIS